MGDYHTVYKGPEGETTQWDDIQAKLGNKSAKVGHVGPRSLPAGQLGFWVDARLIEEEQLAERPARLACRLLLLRRRRLPPPEHASSPAALPPQEPVWKPDAYAPEAEAPKKDAAWVEGRSAEELEEGEDEFDDDRALAEFRCARRASRGARGQDGVCVADGCPVWARQQADAACADVCRARRRRRPAAGASGWRSCSGARRGRALAR